MSLESIAAGLGNDYVRQKSVGGAVRFWGITPSYIAALLRDRFDRNSS